MDDNYHDSAPRTRERREKDKKTMLSRALQKANTAVLLDNAQNYEGAMEAYADACKLLQQVMIRSSGDEDRRKLDAIVSTKAPYVLLGSKDWEGPSARLLTAGSE
jgi:nicotinate-nucleotide pyrophosphorylase